MTCWPIGASAVYRLPLILRLAHGKTLGAQKAAAQQHLDDAKAQIDSMHTDFKQTCRLVHDGHTVRTGAGASADRRSARRQSCTEASSTSSRSTPTSPSARSDVPYISTSATHCPRPSWAIWVMWRKWRAPLAQGGLKACVAPCILRGTVGSGWRRRARVDAPESSTSLLRRPRAFDWHGLAEPRPRYVSPLDTRQRVETSSSPEASGCHIRHARHPAPRRSGSACLPSAHPFVRDDCVARLLYSPFVTAVCL